MSNPKKEKKIRSLVKEATQSIMTSQTLEDAVRSAIQSGDEASMAAWSYNAVLGASQEFTLAVDEVLHSRMNFSEAQIDAFHEGLRDVLTALGEVHSYGNHPMSLEDMKVVGEIALKKYPEERRIVMMKKLGVGIPQADGSKLVLGDEAIPLVKPKAEPLKS